MNTSERRKSGVRSPGVRAQEQFHLSAASIAAIVFCVLIPPVGLVMLWHRGMFKLRGRMLFTAVAFLCMVIMFSILRTGETPAPSDIAPVPYVPSLVTVSPDKVKHVDSVITQVETTPTPVPYDEMVDYAVYVTPAPTQDVGSVVVFAVFDNPVYYHADSMCGQTNRRTLTVAEAVAEGLEPCKRCNPPTF